MPRSSPSKRSSSGKVDNFGNNVDSNDSGFSSSRNESSESERHGERRHRSSQSHKHTSGQDSLTFNSLLDFNSTSNPGRNCGSSGHRHYSSESHAPRNRHSTKASGDDDDSGFGNSHHRHNSKEKGYSKSQRSEASKSMHTYSASKSTQDVARPKSSSICNKSDSSGTGASGKTRSRQSEYSSRPSEDSVGKGQNSRHDTGKTERFKSDGETVRQSGRRSKAAGHSGRDQQDHGKGSYRTKTHDAYSPESRKSHEETKRNSRGRPKKDIQSESKDDKSDSETEPDCEKPSSKDYRQNKKPEEVRKSTGRPKTGEHRAKQISGSDPDAGNEPNSGLKFYKDNPQNRQINRVGELVGTKVLHKSSGKISEEFYVDSPENRRLKRVGKPRGSMPFKRSAHTKKVVEFIKRLKKKEKVVRNNDSDESAFEQAQCEKNRQELDSSSTSLQTLPNLLAEYSGATIPFKDLDLQLQVGRGGYGEVYMTKWKGSVVATKTMRRDKGSQKYAHKQAEEIIKCWTLKHPNIVHFIGAAVELEKLCLVMEYMPKSLYNAIHIEEVVISDKHRLKILQGVCTGLNYMHGTAKMAHCDLKPQNVLLDYEKGKLCIAKLTDFGLTMSTVGSTTVRGVGTPRYSAPEVLRGRPLTGREMAKSDIYSLGLLIFEVIYEEEPLYQITRSQLLREVCDNKKTPDIPADSELDTNLQMIMKRAWQYTPSERPDISEISKQMKEMKTL